ncbi:MAG TPA: GWxTD domain-containing protein [Thermoanaerobaculia bacterium]|nr:GWxTD domain-containing protein [Thermoanaerobaculia bacterium]
MARLVPALVVAALLAAGCASSPTAGAPEDLINPRLGPEHAQWLVGPVAVLATGEEIERYLALGSDAAAAEFIEQFWAGRNPYPNRPDNPLRETFEQRAAEADRRYSEGGLRGRRTDRGTIYVLFGEPTRQDRDISPTPGDPPLELWFYDQAEAGLGGERPQGVYRFVKRGDVTTFYRPRSLDDPRVREPFPYR